MSTLIAPSVVPGNETFFREVKENDEQFRHLLHRLPRHSRQRLRTRLEPDQFADLLAQLRDQLDQRFRLEETCGYFYGPLAIAPNLRSQAAVLHAQHTSLQDEICSLAEAAAALLRRPPDSRSLQELMPRLDAFAKRLHDHEVRENELLCQAYDLDIGVLD